MAHGQIPSQIPAAEALHPEQQVQAYEQAIDTLEQSGAVSAEAVANLRRQEPGIIAAIQVGDLRTALKLASRSVAEPHIDEAIASIRQNSDEQNRLDLVPSYLVFFYLTPNLLNFKPIQTL